MKKSATTNRIKGVDKTENTTLLDKREHVAIPMAYIHTKEQFPYKIDFMQNINTNKIKE